MRERERGGDVVSGETVTLFKEATSRKKVISNDSSRSPLFLFPTDMHFTERKDEA